MEKQEKIEFVAWMKGQLEEASSVVLADYRGLRVAQMNDLRSKCREAGVSFKVVKNTLMILASEGTPAAAAKPFLEGPTAMAWHPEDPGAPARLLVDFAKQKGNEALEIKGGVMGGRALDHQQVKSVLAAMLTREELLAQMAGLLAAGPAKLARAVSAGPSMLGRALAALKEQRQAAGG